jgi:hypothetical protein
MYLKGHVRRKDGKSHVYYSLSESVRYWTGSGGAASVAQPGALISFGPKPSGIAAVRWNGLR